MPTARTRGHRRSGGQGCAEARGRRGDRARRVRLAVHLRRRRAVLGTRPLRPDRSLARHRRVLTIMAEYTLYCFAQSGNAYKPALALALAGADWAPRFVDYLQRRDAHARLSRDQRDGRGAGARASRRSASSQSGVILDYLAETLGTVRPARRRRAARDPALAPVGQPQAHELHGDVPLPAHVHEGSRSRGARRLPQARGDRLGRARRASRRAPLRRRPTG